MAAQLLPPNATALERDLEQSMAHYGDGDARPVPVDTLWRPRECPVDTLPFLAWALGVKRWDPNWPESTRRAVVAGAIEAHRRRGTVVAVRRALADVGALYDLTERPGDVAHTFSIAIYNSNELLGSGATAVIKGYVDDAKRFSTHYTLAVASSLGGPAVSVGAGVGALTVVDVALVIDENDAP